MPLFHEIFHCNAHLYFPSLLPAAYREGSGISSLANIGTWLVFQLYYNSSESQVLGTVGTLLPCPLFLKLFSPISPILTSTHHTQLEGT